MTRGAIALATVLIAGGASPAAAAATDPALPGPFAAAKIVVEVPVAPGVTRTTDVFFPDGGGGTVAPGAGRCPIVAFGHGFTRTRERYTDVGTLLASRGFIVLTADYLCKIATGCDHSGNADEMIAVLDWMAERDTDPASIFFGRVATDRRGTSGHSAGGLQALVAAARDPRIVAAAPMDPVDAGGLGVASLPAARAAVAVSWSEPSSCNAQGSAEDLYAATAAPKRGTKIIGGTHCDPEKNYDVLGCGLVCGAWNSARHQLYMRLMSGWFEYWLHCDPEYADWVLGAPIAADEAAGRLAYQAALTPPAPSGLEAAPTPGGVAIGREAPERCGGADAWRVYRAASTSGPYTDVSGDLPPSETAWTDAGAVAGEGYVYVARDRLSDLRGTHESAASRPAAVNLALAPGEAGVADPLRVVRGPGTSLALAFGPAACATDHVAYWGISPGLPSGGFRWTGQACGLGAGGTATIDPGEPPPGGMIYIVVVGSDGVAEGSYGRDTAGAERPEASGFTGCDYPRRLEDACPP